VFHTQKCPYFDFKADRFFARATSTESSIIISRRKQQQCITQQKRTEKWLII
jgi:hypothetical protein